MDRTERIRQRAFEIWHYRQENNMHINVDRLGCCQPVTALDDWLQAEDDIDREDGLLWGES